MFDSYYDGYIVNETGFSDTERFNRHHAFQAALWEIQDDFDGLNLASLSLDTGNYTKPTGYAGYTQGSAILQDLQTAAIPLGYTSSQFDFVYLQSNGASQNQLLVLNAVPEPSGVFLFGVSGILCLLRRRR